VNKKGGRKKVNRKKRKAFPAGKVDDTTLKKYNFSKNGKSSPIARERTILPNR